MLFKSLAANDVFISYARKDATTYANGLADELTKKNFSCFTDRLGTDASAGLPASLLEEIRGCGMLVVLCTKAARESASVAQEVWEFKRAKGTTRMVVPVVFDQTIDEVDWFQLLKGIAPEFASEEELITGTPSLAVVSRIEKSFNYSRSKERLRRYTVGAGVVLTLLILLSVGASVFAGVQLRVARDAQQNALAAAASAEQARAEADRQAGVAVEKTREADAAAARAGQAEARAGEAQHSQASAEDNRRRAEQQASLAKAAADEQERIAEEQSERNRHLRYVADVNLAQRAYENDDLKQGQDLLNLYLPAGGVEAESRTSAPDDLRGYEWYHLWRLYHDDLATLKGHAAPVNVVAFSPDGKTIVTGDDAGSYKLWDIASRHGTVDLDNESDREKLRAYIGPYLGARDRYSVVFSPSGRTVITYDRNRVVRLWDAASGKELAAFEGSPEGHSNSVALTPDRGTLAIGGDGSPVVIWDIASRRKLVTLKSSTRRIESMALSPDGGMLAIAGYDTNTVELFDTATGREVSTIKSPADDGVSRANAAVSSVAFSPDGKSLATGTYGGTVKVWDITSGREQGALTARTWNVIFMEFSPDGKSLVAGYGDETVRLWEIASGQLVVKAERKTLVAYPDIRVHSVALSPDGKILAVCGSGGTVKLWDAASGEELATLKGHTGEVDSVAFSPDGRTLATGSRDHTVKLWNVPPRPARDDEILPISSLVFSPDSRKVAAFAYDYGALELWDTTSGRRLATLDAGADPLVFAAFSPDAKILLTGSYLKRVKLWDASSGELLVTLDGQDIMKASPDARMFATTDSKSVLKLWDLASGRELGLLKNCTGPVTSAAFSPDGRTLAAADSEGVVGLWDIFSDRLLAKLKVPEKGHLGMVFSPDGEWLATWSDKGPLRLWDAASRRELASFKRTGDEYPLSGFSSDWKMAAVFGGANGTVRLRGTLSGKELSTLKGNTDYVDTAAFASDGKTLVTGGVDGILRLWDVATGQEIISFKHGRRGAVRSFGVESVAFSPDGRILAATGTWGLTLRHAATGEEVKAQR